ncbi:Ssb Single-stranded DNA-binding protein [uncultured Caudovirales phage]|jgi:single-strand DNA-binding protein|uniref:Single-stranded DNA-binding protein n=1 Tax=uncultured Caudovirales phage TaxID=2100421 RepID=A0A6J5NJZ3_9CAUD|nr:Ssb Single-stranded DNA-binding protein [uncultured Caudovirales phage]
MPLPTIVVVGNLTQDVELRFTTTGKAVASLRVACSDRKKDAQGNWVDGDKIFLNVNVWNDTAENVTHTCFKGDTVVVIGKLKQRSYTAKDGTEKTVFEIEADSVGAELRRKSFKANTVIQADKPHATQSDNNPWVNDSF